MAKYTITYDRDESGAWIAKVRGVPEAHSYGRTIEQARARVREALSLWRTNAETAEFADDIRLPTQASSVVKAFIQARKRADSEQLRAQKAARVAAHALTDRWNYSLRDAGELLGVSRQRVKQIKESGFGASRATSRRAASLTRRSGRAAHAKPAAKTGSNAPRG
jgi:predicted RNase H-like HicB family nuclease